MKARFLLPVIIALILLLLYVLMTAGPQEASMILLHGIVHTVDDRRPVAEAVAIRNGRFAGVGSSEEIQKRFRSERVIDLQGRTVVPGLIDAHAHVENLGALLLNLDLVGTTSVGEIQKRVAERAASVAEGGWVRGRGWDQNRWPDKQFPHHAMLDAVVKDVPVYLKRVDGHALWVNRKVLSMAGVTAATPDPPGGRILRDKQGNPTGVLIDNAIDMLDARLPAALEEERAEAITRALDECVRYGLTGVHDMGVDLSGIRIYRKLGEEGKLPLRLYVALLTASGQPEEALGATWNHYMTQGPEIGMYGGRLTVRAVKIYADGALGSRGAAMIAPYSDDPGNRGLTLTSFDVIRAACERALRMGFQPAIHAIGDRGNHVALNVYEDVFTAAPLLAQDARARIEHAQVIEPSDIGRFARFGILPSMQPTHCTSDMYWAEERLGPARLQGAYAWRSLIESGSIIPGGSDFPVESPNPLWGFYAAITRQDHDGWPEGGWHPEQSMTRQEALKAFTLWAAYAAFEEKSRGSIEVGKLADLVILSDDIMTVEPARILQTRVTMTVVGGEVVYEEGSPLP